MDRLIEIDRLRRDFKSGAVTTVTALDGISFGIERGELVSIMGTSGSGKSTLLNILGCLDQPTDGRYVLDGIPVNGMGKDELAHLRNRKIGFVFQSYNLLQRTSALENVELPLLYNRTFSAADRHDRVRRALERVGMGDRMHHTPAQLSGGQQQRVAIARALINDPVLILADEPTGNLDTKTSYDIMDLFQELNGRGTTILLVTHEPDIADFTKRIIMLRDGDIVEDRPVSRMEPVAAAGVGA